MPAGNGPGIVLAATAISFGSAWYQDPTNTPDFRILAAGTFFALFDVGIGAIAGPQAATGLAILMMIGVLVAPPAPGRKTPVGVLASLPIAQGGSKK